MESSSAEVVSSQVAQAIETATQPFLGRWQRLVSTTNWEKGRIVAEWRDAMVAAGGPANDHSDEAWAQRVGGVTSQHVGRLRRVYGRFHATYDTYTGLYWSHFQAAVDWEDAEMWLEGALQNAWSVSQMRAQRAETLGDSAAAGEEADTIIDEDSADGDASDDRITPSVARLAEADLVDDADASGKSSNIFDDSADDSADDDNGHGSSDAETPWDDDAAASGSRPAPIQPFADLPELPDDLQSAFDAFKLAILRHRREGWAEVSSGDVVATLEALKTLAVSPLDPEV